MLLYWLYNSFIWYLVKPMLATEYRITDVSDIGWLQWGQGSVSMDSIQQLYPDQWDYGMKPGQFVH